MVDGDWVDIFLLSVSPPHTPVAQVYRDQRNRIVPLWDRRLMVVFPRVDAVFYQTVGFKIFSAMNEQDRREKGCVFKAKRFRRGFSLWGAPTDLE